MSKSVKPCVADWTLVNPDEFDPGLCSPQRSGTALESLRWNDWAMDEAAPDYQCSGDQVLAIDWFTD